MKLRNNVSAFLIAIVKVHGAPLSTDTSASLSNNGVAQRSPDSAALAPGTTRDTLLGRDTNGELEDTHWDEEIEKRGLGSVIAALARILSKEAVSAGADTAAQQLSVPEVQTRGLRGSPSSKPNKGNGEASSWDQEIVNEILSSLISNGLVYGKPENTTGGEDAVQKRGLKGGKKTIGGSRGGRKSSGSGSGRKSTGKGSSSSPSSSDKKTKISDQGKNTQDMLSLCVVNK